MRRAVLLLAMMTVALLVASGVALAVTKSCEADVQCFGTKKADTLNGSEGNDSMYGKGRGDTLNGFGGDDHLYGQSGADKLFGGPGKDDLSGGPGNDTLDGGSGGEFGDDDYYRYEERNWGKDTITDPTTDNEVLLWFGADSTTGTVTTRLVSDPVRPEVTNAGGTSTINWGGDIIDHVSGSMGDDTITGNGASNNIGEAEAIGGPDTDIISSEGGDDIITVSDGDPNDIVDCGADGEIGDNASIDEGDSVRNCESVITTW